ncbi:hypothetical protein ABBQ38_013746 [Trebouxia sp. C0009 RCD-2024]
MQRAGTHTAGHTIMKAIVYKTFGPPDVLKLVNHPLPQRSAGELLVKVKSTSLNPVDYKTRNGSIPIAKKNKILGGDLAGVVEAADADSKLVKGDKVFGLSPDFIFTSKWGTYAEFATIKSSLVASIPDNTSFDQAAAVPLVSLTAMQALDNAQVQAGKRVLIHGGSGGVGGVAVQIAKARGAHVTSTCSTKNIQLVKELGADEVIDYTKQTVDQVFKNNPFDAVIDQIGGATTSQSLAVLKKTGHISFVLNENINYFKLTAGLALGAVGMGPKHHLGFVRPDGRQMQEVARLLAEGKLKAVIDKTFPLEEAAAAHQYLETGRPSGKVVLQVAS